MTGKHGGVVVLAGILFLVGCSEQRNVTSAWNARAVTIDGKGAEWADVPLDYFEEGDISWGIMNDADKLYLIIGSSNKSSIRILRQSGLTVWFNSTGEKNKREFGLRLRGGAIRWIPPRAVEQPEGQPEAEERTAPQDSYVLALDLTVLDNQGRESPISTSGEDGPAAAAGCDEAICSYEMSVPLKKTDAVKYAINAVQGKKIGIGVELSVPKRGRRSDEEETSGTGPHGGGDHHQGMGSRGMDQGDHDMAGRGPSGDDRDQRGPGDRNPDRGGHEKHKPIELEKKGIWLSVTLAQPQR